MVVGGVVVVAPVGVEVAAPGAKVAMNGECIGVGNTTGTLSTVRDTVGLPSSTLTVPLPWIAWTPPAWRVPVQSVEPDESEVTSTQQGPLAVMTSWYELADTGKLAVVEVDEVAMI